MTKLERMTRINYSGLSEEINLAETDQGQEIRNKISKARKNKEKSYLVKDGKTIWTISWSDNSESVQIHYYRPLGTFEPSGDKSLGDFE